MNSGDEFSLVRDYFFGFGEGLGTIVGPGDDCAVLRIPSGSELATSSDTLIEGVHFPVGSSGDDVAYRAIASSASDLAAMGAAPLASVLALSLPSIDKIWLSAFTNGLSTAIQRFRLPLVGGDLTSGSMAITVTVYGHLPFGKALLRSAVERGDQIVVSGTLGDAAAGLAIIQGKWDPDYADREQLVRRFYRPEPRLDLGVSLRGVANAAIDISDGLLADVGHMASASGLAIQINADEIPLSKPLSAMCGKNQALLWALTGGDDYELCFSVPKNKTVPLGCTSIGIALAGSGVNCVGFDVSSVDKGYRHFY